MDMSFKTPILLFLVVCINSVWGLEVPQPVDLAVSVFGTKVLIHWQPPTNAPSNSKYNVQMGKYTGEWAEVSRCTGIIYTFCDLSSLIHDLNSLYKARVQLVAGHNASPWTGKRVRPYESELQPPSFTLLATSSTLSVSVHHQPVLRNRFPFGLTYTILLEETGQEETTIAYLKDDVGDEERTKTFSSLHWGKEYCVSVKVEGNGALSASPQSAKQCLVLPIREWFVIAVSSLSILGVLAFFAIIVTIILCYVKQPAKTPAALKSPTRYWLPLTVEEGIAEVVTDKGWLLSRYESKVKNSVNHPVTHLTITEDTGKEDRRPHMESNRGCPSLRQDDSGCGSLGGPESSMGSQTVYSLQDEQPDADKVRKREDSGVGLGCQLDSDGLDMKESVPVGSYRTQSPSAVHTHGSDDDEAFKQILPDTALAGVVTGYRAGPQVCICSGAGQCTWCHKQGHNETEVAKQYRATCIENVPLGSSCDFVDSYRAGLTFPSKSTKSQMDIMDDFKITFKHLGDTLALLSTRPPLVEGGLDFNMNNVCLSLSDVQLTTD